MLATVARDDLVELYRRDLSTDVSRLIGGDLNFYGCDHCCVKFFHPLITGDEQFYNSLQHFDWYYADNKQEYQVAKGFIDKGDVVLDVGSGRGAFAQHLPSARFIGLDDSEHARDIASRDGVDVRCQSIESYAEQHPESVDVVTAFQVLEHVADPYVFVESLLGALKPGGRMIIAVPSESSFWGQVCNNSLNMPPHHVTRWTDDAFRFIARNFRVELEEIYHERVQPIHAGIYFSTLAQRFFMEPRLVDLRFSRRLAAGITWRLAICFAKPFVWLLRPDGHTVLALFRKPAGQAHGRQVTR